MKIDSFKGKYAFLSNFYVDSNGFCVEHHYQAAKSSTESDYNWIISAPTAAKAKTRGRIVGCRPGFEEDKLLIMENLVRLKFKNSELTKMLLDTEDAELIESNWWGDRFWGVCNGEGKNHLGKILMKIREELRCGKSI